MSSRLLGEIGVKQFSCKKDRANLKAAASVSDVPAGFWRLQVLYPVRDCIYACLTAFLPFFFFRVAAWNVPAFRTAVSGFWHSGLFGYSLYIRLFSSLPLNGPVTIFRSPSTRCWTRQFWSSKPSGCRSWFCSVAYISVEAGSAASNGC